MYFNVQVHVISDGSSFVWGSIHVVDLDRFLQCFFFQSFGSDVVLIDELPAGSTDQESFFDDFYFLLLESFMGKFIELLSTRATKQLAIDKMLRDTDVEAVLRFKNPVLRLYRSSLLPKLARQIALLFHLLSRSGEVHESP